MKYSAALVAPVLALAAACFLSGCTTVLNQRQAQGYATASLNRFCIASGPCGPRRVSAAQRLKQGWLIEFDSTAARYGVMVHDDRATEVSVWKKAATTAPGG